MIYKLLSVQFGIVLIIMKDKRHRDREMKTLIRYGGPEISKGITTKSTVH